MTQKKIKARGQLYFRCSAHPKFVGWDKVYYKNMHDSRLWLDESKGEGNMYLFGGEKDIPIMLAEIRDSDYYNMYSPSQFAQIMKDNLRKGCEIIVSFFGNHKLLYLSLSNIKPVVQIIERSSNKELYDPRFYPDGYSWNRKYQILSHVDAL